MTVALDIWTVPATGVAPALWRMARDPRRLSGLPGLRFHKSLGTGAGRTFTMRDADLRQWALLSCWDGPDTALDPTRDRWGRRARSHTRVLLGTIATHGRWSGTEPFTADPDLRRWGGKVAAITRARVRTRWWGQFQRAIPPVVASLELQDGLLFRMGIGEAPVGLQGTFSVWRDSQALRDFAYRQPAHTEVITRTAETGWYSEDLFARFAVLDVSGDMRW
jgi:hypothetical protein